MTCIGEDALDVFDGLDFANADEKKDIDVVVAKLKKYCIEETNETYERNYFNRRDQASKETVNAYFTALQKLAKQFWKLGRQPDNRSYCHGL